MITDRREYLCTCGGLDIDPDTGACIDCGHEAAEHDLAGRCEVDMRPWGDDNKPAVCKWATATAGHGPCEGPAKFRIVYRSAVTREVRDTEEPYCFRHALIHVDRAHAAGSIAYAEFEEIA